MDKEARQSAFLSALSTERFALQSAAGMTINESGARASLYMLSLSSFLVATGFVAETTVFAPFVATVLPGVFVLGIFTIVRLVDTAIENMRTVSAIARIRRYYRSLTPEAPIYFAPWASEDDDLLESIGMGGTSPSPFLDLFTTASMVIVINAIVAGAGVALLGRLVLGTLTSVLIGVGAGIACAAVFFAYQHRRLWKQARAVQAESPAAQ